MEVSEHATDHGPDIGLYDAFKAAVVSNGTLIWRQKGHLSGCLVTNDVDLSCKLKVSLLLVEYGLWAFDL